MKKKANTPFNVLCVWPGTVIGDNHTDEVVKWFKEQFGVRISDVQEIQTISLLDDGTLRSDMLFTMHEEDVPRFAIPRLSTDIKWWGDWVNNRPDDFTDAQREMFKDFEF